ncbi:hypothetical protein HanXRQr2_Chr05g0220961 [Helianthus annuus]|uniref:Uncharacterized protein n=1 Tax=Helianthus annuus TaxID=4232 RepID=A0A9K3J068_HELAN|nr:hypothetical protein HanXRQr2_Chr05g0220961 [Helianthus annuus]
MPHSKDNIKYIFSTAINGKIKAWLHVDRVSKIDYETDGYVWTKWHTILMGHVTLSISV